MNTQNIALATAQQFLGRSQYIDHDMPMEVAVELADNYPIEDEADPLWLS